MSDPVELLEGKSALSILHELLLDAVTTYPDTFADAEFPVDEARFRTTYPDATPRFEVARLASADRVDIAVHMLERARHVLRWGGSALHEVLAADTDVSLTRRALGGTPGWQASVVYKGERFDSPRLGELGDRLVAGDVISVAAGAALRWVGERLDGAPLDLSDRRIVMLGGGAEMSPARIWLEAGADLLWIDTQPPPAEWFEDGALAGSITWCEDGLDLLARPAQALAAIERFAEAGPVDIGLYAYAPGKAREMRLTGVMNALVDALADELIASVTMLVSPTTPTALTPDDVAAMARRANHRPAWASVANALGLMGRGGGLIGGPDADPNADQAPAVPRNVVAIQGGSYQAAQYLGKVLTAEVWSRRGRLGAGSSEPLRVSANTAAITKTRSLDHPVFAAAFGGAQAFGVETMTPRQSRRINGLLAVRDWLIPDRPTPGELRVHGGIHTLPYPLGSALRVAAGIGFARSPRLLKGLIRGA